ncbi:ABC transporter permease [Microaerobacter geothermalis]|uniref:ABC transporter permease n=1 Tax=Microaerobacter geothermalis TaxID=674972 RepID=UPI001F322E03|nr:ABC transporter permease [Microaerobacter geothermalis]MCF6093395.1 ABC transporter permease [Microaerobacter geothermalis]
MRSLDSLRLVWRNLWRMKLRTFLTSIGVAIGTAAIVAMISLGLGLKANAVKSFENFANITELNVMPAYPEMGGPGGSAPFGPGDMKQLTQKTVQELKAIPGVEAVMAVNRLRGQSNISFGRKEGFVNLVGVEVAEAARFDQKVEKGTYLTGKKNEIVISADIPQNLRDLEQERRQARKSRRGTGGSSEFSGANGPSYGPVYEGRFPGSVNQNRPSVELVNKTVTLVLTRYAGENQIEKKEIKVRVVGQLAEGQREWGAAYAPIELVNELNQWLERSGSRGKGVYGENRRGSSKINGPDYEQITVKVASREQVEQVVQRIKEIGYNTWSPTEQLKEINRFFLVVELILGGVAAISLLVASIGITNTMIMSILERTREIGVMKVIGATVYNIRWLFLLESGSIGFFGGVIGLLAGMGIGKVANMIAASQPDFRMFGDEMTQIAVMPLWLILSAVGFATFVGVISGLFPAIRASRLSPIQAIRTE